MSLPYELYRYAAPGERQLKYHHANRQQQVRYLPGVEIRTCAATARLRVIAVGNSHIYLTASQNMAHFNLADRLGSLSGVVDEQGTLVSRETWYPFGGTASWLTGAQAGAALKFQRYVGKERDASGLIFFGWRYLVPWEMRWLNGDPAGTVDGLNLFCMVRNNPATLRDLDGRMISGDEPLDLSVSGGAQQPSVETLPPKKRWMMMNRSPDAVPSPLEVIPVASTSSNTASQPPVTTLAEDPPQPGTSTDSKLKQQSRVKQIPCRCCNPPVMFKDYPTRIKHENEKNNVVFRCDRDDCGKSFNSQRQLNAHINSHTGEKPYVCNTCGKSYGSGSGLSQHKTIHDQSGRYFCKQCKLNLSGRAALNQHNRSFHTEEVQYPCSLCGKIFYSEYQLKMHKNKGH